MSFGKVCLVNELVAIDPDTLNIRNPLELKRDLYQINREFGFEHGRFLANYPDSYDTYCKRSMEALQSMSDGFSKQEIKKRFEQFLTNLLPVEASYNREFSWIENVRSQYKDVFDLVVTNSSEEGFYTFDALVSGDISQLAQSGRESKVVATAKNYSEVITPLLCSSTELFIADRYFPFIGSNSKDSEIEQGLDLLCRLIKIAERNKRCKWIVFISDFATQIELSNHDKELKIKKTLAEIRKRTGKKMFCKLGWELVKGKELKEIHERYVFSMKGCVSFDKGLICDGKSRKVCYETRPSLEITLNKLRKYMRRR